MGPVSMGLKAREMPFSRSPITREVFQTVLTIPPSAFVGMFPTRNSAAVTPARSGTIATTSTDSVAPTPP